MCIEPKFMRLALEQAYFAVGVSRPNPPVGAVVVANGVVVGKGFTQAPGLPHAEVMALADAGGRAIGADLWVTLEPCCHYGRTPPCTLAICNAGIRRVFYSHGDLNPLVCSQSKSILEASGIQVFGGVIANEINAFYEAYDYFVRTKRTFIELKVAQTQDGFIAGKNGERLAITGEEANSWTNRLRAASDAILIGAGTLEADDPLLSLRGEAGNPPERIILAGKKTISLNNQMFYKGKPPIVYSQVPQPEIENLADVRLLKHESFASNWNQIIDDLSKAGMHRLLVETGSRLSSLILEACAWNRYNVWVSTKKVLEGLSWALKVEVKDTSEDQLVSFFNTNNNQ